ncbi:MAG TPA: hypothetical protein VFN67_34740, partial [Polyangiales bacterium]|nr:hypothetical protein [Polyangiales bacterium]
ALPDRPFLAWLKEAAAQQEAEALRPEHAQPIRVPTVAAESSEKLVLDIPDMQAIARPLPLAARVQPVAEPEPDYSYLTWVGCFCAIGLVCLTLWPFEVNAVTQGSFQRYSQIELAVSPLQAPVVAVHVVPGQRVQAGAPLISFDASAFEHELAELNTALDTALVAQVAAQAAQQAVLDAQAQKQVEAQSGIEQRAAKKPAELAMLEANVLPVEPSALDDRMDERRRKPQAIQDQHEQLSAGSEVEQLAHTITSLRERRVALQRKLHSRQVVAAHGGIVTQVVPALGDMVDSGAPVVRIVPDNPVLRLIALFDIREANDLRVAKHAILTLGADEMVVGAQVVRVHGHEVELKLDDAASVPEVDRQLQRDAHLSAEFERERSLLALAVERLRARHRH